MIECSLTQSNQNLELIAGNYRNYQSQLIKQTNMYFFTQSGKKDASSFAQVATFYIDKFPAAFGATATYYNTKGVASDETYVRIDFASKVEYDFEEDS